MVDFPANTESIRNLEQRYLYFLVVKFQELDFDVPQKKYFVYRFIVPVSSKRGERYIRSYFKGEKLQVCQSISDIEYASGIFTHPEYKRENKTPLRFPLKDIPIYIQTKINRIDLEKDVYQMGSKPIIRDKTSVILPDSFNQRRGGNIIIDPI